MKQEVVLEQHMSWQKDAGLSRTVIGRAEGILSPTALFQKRQQRPPQEKEIEMISHPWGPFTALQVTRTL